MFNIHSFRRGQIFSFTLTELILLILFILLLLLWFVTDKQNKIINDWTEVTGTNAPQEFKDLYPNFPDKTTEPDLRDQLIVANKIIEEFKDKTGKDDPSEIPKSVKEMIADVEEGLGRNPPCWPKGWPAKDLDYEKSDRIFNVLFIGTNKLAVIADYEDVYKDQYELLPIDKNILSTNDNFKNNALNIISSNQFIRSFEPLLKESKKAIDIKHNNLTLQRDCRHEVRIFIENEDITRKEYIRLKEETVENIFTTFRFREDTYLDYLIKYKQ
jgi:competence protein ComGC